jgi:hypothetical protein
MDFTKIILKFIYFQFKKKSFSLSSFVSLDKIKVILEHSFIFKRETLN